MKRPTTLLIALFALIFLLGAALVANAQPWGGYGGYYGPIYYQNYYHQAPRYYGPQFYNPGYQRYPGYRYDPLMYPETPLLYPEVPLMYPEVYAPTGQW